MHRLRLTTRAVAIAVLAAMAGCVTAPHPPAPKPKPVPPVPKPAEKKSYWQDAGVTGDPFIIVDLTEQRAHFFKGKTEVGQAVISSGKKGFETPTGDFKVIQRDKNHVSNLYGEFVDLAGTVVKSNVDISKQKPAEGDSFQGAKMPFFLRFYGGAGMHAGHVTGRPISHGCVRLPRFMAEHFWDNAPLGTPVLVK